MGFLKLKNFRTVLKLAYLEDEFQYFDHIENQKAVAEPQIFIWQKMILIISSMIKSPSILLGNINSILRKVFSQELNRLPEMQVHFTGLLRWNPSERLYFEAGIKKDLVEKITTPVLFSFSGKMKVNSWWNTVLNLSKNFRYPSFNDLYWQPGGNLNLI